MQPAKHKRLLKTFFSKKKEILKSLSFWLVAELEIKIQINWK